MKRWLRVIGVDDVLVPDPHVDSNPRRFVGKAMLDFNDEAVQARWAELDGHHHERFQNVEQVLADDPMVRVEIEHGHLILIEECVANTHAQAVVKMTKSASPTSAPATPQAAPARPAALPIAATKDGDK